MALLLLVAAIRERFDPALDSIAVLTVDHGLRPEARVECDAALALAERLCISRRARTRVTVERSGNILERARIARYRAARSFVDEHGCEGAVVAHTADDRAESLLLGLRRGLGLAALARLVPVAEPAVDDFPRLFRPLLSLRRAQLRGFLTDLGVAWHDDPSNDLHARGAIRNDPSLAALVEAIADGSGRLMDEADELLRFRARELRSRIDAGRTSMERAAFDALPHALQGEALRELVRSAGGDLSNAVLDSARAALAAADRAPRSFACKGGVELRIDARVVAANSLR